MSVAPAPAGAPAMGPRARFVFPLLILAQAAHSAEEFALRLYDVLPPARWISDRLSDDRTLGFMIANVGLVLFGLLCWLALVRPRRRAARPVAWFWAILEMANGVGHLLLTLAAGGYFPGVATAPVLLILGAWLAACLATESRSL